MLSWAALCITLAPLKASKSDLCQSTAVVILKDELWTSAATIERTLTAICEILLEKDNGHSGRFLQSIAMPLCLVTSLTGGLLGRGVARKVHVFQLHDSLAVFLLLAPSACLYLCPCVHHTLTDGAARIFSLTSMPQTGIKLCCPSFRNLNSGSFTDWPTARNSLMALP